VQKTIVNKLIIINKENAKEFLDIFTKYEGKGKKIDIVYLFKLDKIPI
jgi:hypothetical protein